MKDRSRRKIRSMSVALLTLLLLMLSITTSATKAEEPVHAPSVTERPASSKPFWIDKGIFTSEDWLFVVGVATASTQEEARSRSLDAAKRELAGHLKNYSDMQGLETKELWEEKSPANRTFTTYRLVMLKLRDWTPLVVDKSKVEEVAQILAKIEERKAKEATDAEQAKATQKLRERRAQALHINNFDVLALGWQCKDKDLYTNIWQSAQTPEGRKRVRKLVERQNAAWLSFETDKRVALERMVDREISLIKDRVDSADGACERLKEADVIIAEQQQKKAGPLKRLRYWEERLWKERFPNGHPAGAEAEAEVLASPRK